MVGVALCGPETVGMTGYCGGGGLVCGPEAVGMTGYCGGGGLVCEPEAVGISGCCCACLVQTPPRIKLVLRV